MSLAGRTVHVVDAVIWDDAGNEIDRKSYTYRNPNMSWKPEVRVNNDSKWYDNAVRLETKAEAYAYACDLLNRWTSAVEVRATEVTEPANGTWIDGKMVWDEDVK